MQNVVPKTIAVQKAIDDVIRRDRGRLLSGLISRLRDFELAEDVLQDAIISALNHWGQSGVPHSPTSWLMKAALNKGIDRIRAKSRELKKTYDLSQIISEHTEIEITETITDERLRLIFTCCHPALEEKSRIALTLRTVCNLTTREIAAVFLDSEKAMGQRLSRAKAKIKAKGICFRVPEPEQWADRLDTVLSTLYLIFTTGYVGDDNGPRDLCQEGIFLSRLLCELKPDEPEMEAALALMLLTEARRPARICAQGALVPIEDQNHALWCQNYLSEGRKILEHAIQRQQPGPFQIKAAITDCHMTFPGPDWQQMSLLYQSLWGFEPTAVVALNWAVVIAETGNVDMAFQTLDHLQGEMAHFQPWHAARANILIKLGRVEDACDAYLTAIENAPNLPAQKFLERKLEQIRI